MNLYGRQKAVDYAHTLKNRCNSQFFYFENLGGEHKFYLSVSALWRARNACSFLFYNDIS